MRIGMGKIWVALAACALGASPALAQVRTIDPNSAIDADLSQNRAPAQPQQPQPIPAPDEMPEPSVPAEDPLPPQQLPEDSVAEAPPPAAAASEPAGTYQKDDILSAAEGVFGKGAEGLAGIVEDILKDQGEPNAYVAGSEAGGALVVGLRYGSGMLTHKVEGQRKVFWTGPSVGFDVGGDANKVFVLVYNLYDSQDLYKRFPAGEGRVYFVGGFSATYLRRGDVVLIPVRLGVGWRLGVNAGYMKFTEKSRWFPF